MKKRAIVFLLLTGVCGCIYAFAGALDRFYNAGKSVFIVVLATCIMQVAALLVMKHSKHQRVCLIRKKFLCLARKTSRNWWLSVLVGWLLSTFVITMYFTLLFYCLFIFGILLILAFWVYYWFIMLSEKRRTRWMTGLRQTYFFMIASTVQIAVFAVIGILLGACWLLSLIPENNFHNIISSFGIDILSYGVYSIALNSAAFAILFAIPFLILLAIRLIKTCIHK